MVITESVRFKGGNYLLPSSSEDPWQAVITIQGDNLTIDMKGATLMGTPADTLPDARKGTAIRVQGNNVIIKNATVRGYKLGLIADGAQAIKVLDSDFSYNWKQRLKSTPEREDLSDWMSFHQNDKDEWLRFGSAIYLKDCDEFEVKGTKALGGQSGLMITGCDNGLVWNNNFSFLSAIGLGMYRSSNNRVMHNNIDWCVRGYSHKVYNRGQDSAGILVYEQSNNNTFAYNSATHGGDGFFLWAGQATMDTGQGGCNDNLLFGNDFSHAPTNGIETTFSRNAFVNNYVRECWHGVWGGYSYESLFLYNFFSDNDEGITIEHGQDNKILGNWFRRDDIGIRLWQNDTQDPNWGYPKHRDTKSRDYQIQGNHLSGSITGIQATNTAGIKVSENRFQLNDLVLKLAGSNPGFEFSQNTLNSIPADKIGYTAGNGNEMSPEIAMGLVPDWDPFARSKSLPAEVLSRRPEPLKGGMDPFSKLAAPRGRVNIIVDEWGPYDFRYPRIWPFASQKQTVQQAGRGPEEARATVQKFRVMGPPGTWKLVGQSGIQKIEPISGEIPGEIEVTLPEGQAVDIKLDFEYRGEETVDFLGRQSRKGDRVPFSYSKFFVPISWEVKIFSWTDATDPRTQPAAFSKLITGQPLYTRRVERLDFGTSRSFFPVADHPRDKFATVAEGTVNLPAGDYEFELTTDDGARVWIDGKLVIDEWKYQGPTAYSTPIKGGEHRIRIEHFEIDGYAALKAEIRKR